MWHPRRLIGAFLALGAAVLLMLSPFFALFVGYLDARTLRLNMTIDGWGFDTDAPQRFGSVPVNAYSMVFSGIFLIAATIATVLGARKDVSPGMRRGSLALLAMATAFTIGVTTTITPQVTSWLDSFRPVGAITGNTDSHIGIGFWMLVAGSVLAVGATVLTALPVRQPDAPTPPYGFPRPVVSDAMESVVLLDETGQSIGTADKATVHHQDTPLHLAFSAYVFDEQGRFLLTRRALAKRTWPGVWTNSCCGHPGPGEAMYDTVTRRLKDELGLLPATIDLVLPKFRYRAVMSDGVVENEMCPVFRVTVTGEPRPNPAEVEQFEWVDWPPQRELSPWAALQIPALTALGEDPRQWPAADPAELPPAAR